MLLWDFSPFIMLFIFFLKINIVYWKRKSFNKKCKVACEIFESKKPVLEFIFFISFCTIYIVLRARAWMLHCRSGRQCWCCAIFNFHLHSLLSTWSHHQQVHTSVFTNKHVTIMYFKVAKSSWLRLNSELNKKRGKIFIFLYIITIIIILLYS